MKAKEKNLYTITYNYHGSYTDVQIAANDIKEAIDIFSYFYPSIVIESIDKEKKSVYCRECEF